MTFSSIGDQARAYTLQTASQRIKTTLSVLTTEMSSGEVADLGGRLQGNTQALNNLEARIALVEQFQRNGAEAASLTLGMSQNLDVVRNIAADLSTKLSLQVLGDSTATLTLRAGQASGAFESAVANLNSSVAGRFIFSGTQTDVPPLVPASQMLDDLSILTAGMTTAEEVAQAVSDWFDAPPGADAFIDRAYRGSIAAPFTVQIGENQLMQLTTTAIAPAVREQLKGFALSALVDRGILSGQPAEMRALFEASGQHLNNNAGALIGEMARIGYAQQVIEQTESENFASSTTLEIARNVLRSADPFDTAAAITETQNQLETLYAVTARLSKLRLVDYLR